MIKLSHLNKSFSVGGQEVHILKDIDLAIAQGEFVAIMGASGSGKSTLINIIGFLDKAFDGDYQFSAQAEQSAINVQEQTLDTMTRLRNQNVGFIFQNFKLINTMTVLENVMLPLLYAGMTRMKAKAQALETLAAVKISEQADKLPSLLSGGQQQRVAIARAIVAQPNFLIADEPTGALDSKTSAEIMALLKDLNRKGTTIIMVTHDSAVGSVAKRLIRIQDGALIDDNIQLGAGV